MPVIPYLVTDDTFIFEAYLNISCQSTSINSGLAAAAAAEKAERQNTERQNERQNTERQNTERELERRGRKEEGVSSFICPPFITSSSQLFKYSGFGIDLKTIS